MQRLYLWSCFVQRVVYYHMNVYSYMTMLKGFYVYACIIALQGRVKGEKARILRDKGTYRGERKFSYQFHSWLEYRINVISAGAYYLLEVFHYFAPSYTNQFTSIKQLSNLISSFPTQKMVIFGGF